MLFPLCQFSRRPDRAPYRVPAEMVRNVARPRDGPMEVPTQEDRMRFLSARLAALVAAVGFVVCSSGAARAEVGGFHVNVTPYAGFVAFDEKVNVQDKMIWGGRLGFGFGRVIAIEGSYGKSSSDTKTGFGYQPYVPDGATAGL